MRASRSPSQTLFAIFTISDLFRVRTLFWIQGCHNLDELKFLPFSWLFTDQNPFFTDLFRVISRHFASFLYLTKVEETALALAIACQCIIYFIDRWSSFWNFKFHWLLLKKFQISLTFTKISNFTYFFQNSLTILWPWKKNSLTFSLTVAALINAIDLLFL